MSFHQKSAWACLLSIVLVFTPYFYVVFQFPLSFVGLLPLAVIAISVLLTAFHIVNAVTNRAIRKSGHTPPRDELEKMIELKAAKWSGVVLAFAVATWCFFAMFAVLGLGIRAENMAFQGSTSQILMAIQTLFAGFVIANMAYYGGIIIGYARPMHG